MNEDKYVHLDFADIIADPNLTRREFMKCLGGGIIVFLWMGDSSILEAQGRGRGYPGDFNAYLRIGGDGRVTCFTGKVELVITSLAQMLAEELEVPLEAVDMVMGDTAVCPWDMGTFGSMSTRFFGPPLRAAGAEAKAVLMKLAAKRLGIPPDRLVAQDGVIFDRNQEAKRVTYAQLADGKTITREVKEKGVLKKPSEFKVMGKSFSRADALEEVQGKAKYSGDIQFSDMLYAKILRPPAHGAKLTSVDTSAVETIKAVRMVRDGDMVAVLHKNPDVAEKALKKINGYTHKFDQSRVEAGLKKLVARASSADMALALGTCFIEPDDGRCYNQVRFYDSDGKFLGFHAKTLRCGTMTRPSKWLSIRSN